MTSNTRKNKLRQGHKGKNGLRKGGGTAHGKGTKTPQRGGKDPRLSKEQDLTADDLAQSGTTGITAAKGGGGTDTEQHQGGNGDSMDLDQGFYTLKNNDKGGDEKEGQETNRKDELMIYSTTTARIPQQRETTTLSRARRRKRL